MHDELNRVEVKPRYQELKFERMSAAEQSLRWSQYY
jgi:hypothetical protein